jgi:hypothetical protein
MKRRQPFMQRHASLQLASAPPQGHSRVRGRFEPVVRPVNGVFIL